MITPLDLEREYHITGGNIFHGAISYRNFSVLVPFPHSPRIEPQSRVTTSVARAHIPVAASWAHPGHNAAFAVLANLDPSRAPKAIARPSSKGFVEQVMSTDIGNRAGYEIARRSVFRPFARFAAKTPKK